MFQGIDCRQLVKVTCIAALACVSFAADAPPAPAVPQSVCEILRDLPAYAGKDVAVLGRYSFRSSAVWIGEQSCSPALEGASALQLEEEPTAPKLLTDFALDAKELHRKFADIRNRTALGKFRFGTPDYDRWAVIYGRIDKRTLLFRGSGVIMFLTGQE